MGRQECSQGLLCWVIRKVVLQATVGYGRSSAAQQALEVLDGACQLLGWSRILVAVAASSASLRQRVAKILQRVLALHWPSFHPPHVSR